MANIKVLLFPGINREKDIADAFERAGNKRPEIIWHKDTQIGDADLIVIPGGFSYGDYLRCGAMAANAPIIKDLKDKAAKGTPILGVCNGFQILVETGLLPGALIRNENLKFICKHVHLKSVHQAERFTKDLSEGAMMRVPVAHGEGHYFADDDTLKALNDNGQIAFQYCDEDGHITPESNPNGSVQNIAGIYNKDKTILGMMPHPENAVDPYHGGQDGMKLFSGILEALS